MMFSTQVTLQQIHRHKFQAFDATTALVRVVFLHVRVQAFFGFNFYRTDWTSHW